MKKVIAIYLLLLMTLGANAQFGMGKAEDIDKVVRRKLLVVVEAPDQKVMAKYEKKGKTEELKRYKAYLEKYNADMKEVVEKYWPYNKKDMVFKTFDEVVKLKDQKNKSYAVLVCYAAGNSDGSFTLRYEHGLHDMKNTSELDVMKADQATLNHYVGVMHIVLIEELGGRPVYNTNLPDILPGKSTILFGLRSMKSYFDSRILKEHDKDAWKRLIDSLGNPTNMDPERLKNRTLMIREDWLATSLPAADVKKYYPYPYKICTEDELYDMLGNPRENMAVMFPQQFSPMTRGPYEIKTLVYDPIPFYPITTLSNLYNGWTKVTKENLEQFMKSKK